jgi:ATP-dependent Clp protease ATP-binding subunit ClpA
VTTSSKYPLSSRARIVLATARGVAAARGDTALTPTHVAIGLLREAENPAVAALQVGGVNVRAVRHDLEQSLGPPGHPRHGESAIPVTPEEERFVELAAAESERRDEPFIGPHHLLLAILRDESSPAARTFANHGFALDAAATHLQFVLDGGLGGGAGAV